MRVAVLTGSVSRLAGGFFLSVRRLSQHLASLQDMSVSVIGLRDEFSAADLPVWTPLEVGSHRVYGPKGFGFAPGLRSQLMMGKFDFVHTHGIWMYSSIAARSWAGRAGAPTMISPRGMLDPWALQNSRWKKVLAGWLFENSNLRNASCLHALCSSEADAIRGYGLRNPICIIPNGIDVPDESDGMEQHGLMRELHYAGYRLLLYLGRLHPKKNLVNLLKAWAGLRNSFNKSKQRWLLAVAGWGQGEYEAELRRVATELDIGIVDDAEMQTPQSCELAKRKFSWNVLFLGPQYGRNKASCYHFCDAFVLPSLSEGLPMAVLESWAYAKPVLMTEECNIPEGFAAHAAVRIGASPEAIMNGLRLLMEMSSSERLAIGLRGRQLVESQFSWTVVAARMKSVYDWILGGGAMPDCVDGRR